MTGLDTNVLVRYIMQDDAAQSAQASRVIEALTVDKPGFVTMVSMVELVWVLDTCYHLARTKVTTALETLLCTTELQVERAEIVWQAVRVLREGKGDFADCLIERCATAGGCARTLTFDRGAAKHAGMHLIG